MSIYDDINNASTVDELSTLWQTEFANFQALRTSFNEKSQERNQLSIEISDIESQLAEYGDPKDVRDAFHLRLGFLTRNILNE